MRSFLLSLTLLLGLCGPTIAEEVAEEAADEAADRKAVEAFLKECQRAEKEQDAAAIRGQVDVDGLMESLAREGIFSFIAPGRREEALRAIRMVLAGAIEARSLLPAFESFELVKVRTGTAPGMLIATVHLREADGFVVKLRMHLGRRGERLLIQDVEDLDTGLRMLAMMSMLIVEVARGGMNSQMMADFHRLEQAIELLEPEDSQGLLELLTQEQALELPDMMQLAVQLDLAGVCLDLADPDAALAHVSQAAELKTGVPLLHALRAQAFNQLGQSADAVREAQAYLAAVGDDSQVNLELGLALYALNRKPEALTAFRKVLAEPPLDFEALAYLALSLPSPTQAELRPLFVQLDDTLADFDEIGEICVEEKAPAVLRLFLRLFEKQHPDHHFVPFYEGRAALLDKDYAGAATFLKRAYERYDEKYGRGEAHDGYVDWYLSAMSSHGKYLVAFETAPNKAAAFRYLAHVLVDHKNPDVLMELVARAGNEEEVLLERRFYTGEVHFLRKHYEAALAVLRPLREELCGTQEENEARAELLWDLEDRLVRSLLRAKQPGLDEALVLAKQISARDEDWDYLVMVLAQRGDVAGALAAMEKAIETEADARRLFEDEDLKDLLAGEAYKAAREKHLPKR